jgi:hypothetical protein
MRGEPECRCYADHLIAEHRRLHALLRQMRQAIARGVEPDERPSFDEVARVLARLRQELVHHFAEEEDGGCLDEAVSRCPRLAGEAKRIESEHPQILAEIDRLAAQARELPPTYIHQLAIQREFDRLCQELCAHEKAENTLIAQGFGIAISGEDNAQRPLILDV